MLSFIKNLFTARRKSEPAAVIETPHVEDRLVYWTINGVSGHGRVTSLEEAICACEDGISQHGVGTHWVAKVSTP